jgi:CHAT domain-containing protein
MRFVSWMMVGLAIAVSPIVETEISVAQPIGGTVAQVKPEPLKQALDRGDIEDAVRQIETGWKSQYETYYERKIANPLLSIEQMQAVLRQNASSTGKRSAIVYVVPTPNALELLVISPDGKPVHHRVNEAKPANLKALLDTFRENVVNVERDPEDYLPPAQALHRLIIQPIEAELKAQNITNLIFCLGANLRSTPIAALHDGKQFLAEKYSVAIVPAFSLMSQRPANLQNARVLAMGASEFQDLKPLREVPKELDVIDSLWEGQKFLNQDFTVTRLNAERSRAPYSILHLATHAAFSPGQVNDSYIQFWEQRVQLSQVQKLNLNTPEVQLLVLSACQTALGDQQAELGFAGLAVQSGSQAAIASLWRADDAGTLVLMTEFYRQLRTAPSKAEALRRAQTALLSKQVSAAVNLATRSGNTSGNAALNDFVKTNLSHPYYWATFTLIGNPW